MPNNISSQIKYLLATLDQKNLVAYCDEIIACKTLDEIEALEFMHQERFNQIKSNLTQQFKLKNRFIYYAKPRLPKIISRILVPLYFVLEIIFYTSLSSIIIVTLTATGLTLGIIAALHYWLEKRNTFSDQAQIDEFVASRIKSDALNLLIKKSNCHLPHYSPMKQCEQTPLLSFKEKSKIIMENILCVSFPIYSLYLTAGYLASTYAFISTAAGAFALGPPGLSIAFGVALGIGLYCYYKQCKYTVFTKKVAQQNSELNHRFHFKEKHYKKHIEHKKEQALRDEISQSLSAKYEARIQKLEDTIDAIRVKHNVQSYKHTYTSLTRHTLQFSHYENHHTTAEMHAKKNSPHTNQSEIHPSCSRSL